jgi:hypothetical protein
MRAWVVVSSALVVLGLAPFFYKIFFLNYPLSTGEEPNVWRVELATSVTGEGAWTTVQVSLPRPSESQHLLSEEVRSGRLQFSISEEAGDRYGLWAGDLDGTTAVSYQASVQMHRHFRRLPAADPRTEYSEDITAFLGDSPGIPQSDPMFGDLSNELLLDPRDKVKLAGNIYQFVSREIGASLSSEAMDATAVVQSGRGNALGRARLFCALARVNGLPCRVPMGLALAEDIPEALSYWNEVFLGDTWVPYDVVERRATVLPPDRLVLSTRDAVPVRVSGASAVSHRFFLQSESQVYEDLLRRRLSESDNLLDRFSILLLPVQLQQNLRLLVLVPLAALVITLLRNVVGLRTFGMFMPMLIALAFTATGLLIGSAVFAVIIAFAVLSRLLMQRLYLLLVARVAFILTLVVLLMVVIILAGDQTGIALGGIAAFPLVIMTMIVERISVSLEEEGLDNTLRRIAATVVAIYITYAVIFADALQSLFLVFPELMISILGFLVAVGRYTGYRLSELVRFRVLGAAPLATTYPGGAGDPIEHAPEDRR